jgi:hypothetical protein
LSSGLKGPEIIENLSGKAAHVGHFIRLTDGPLRIDEVGDAQGEMGTLIIRRADDLIPGTHLPVDIGQQSEAELLSFGEGFVVLGGIEGRAEDDAAGRCQVGGPVTQALALASSP